MGIWCWGTAFYIFARAVMHLRVGSLVVRRFGDSMIARLNLVASCLHLQLSWCTCSRLFFLLTSCAIAGELCNITGPSATEWSQR